MPANLGLQDFDQFGLHENVVVPDVEAYQALALELLLETLQQQPPVSPFHDENDVRPVDVIR
ncbi:hypothetical protein [Devosia sp.]|uniref:hypothetical protein n=1 Tax=Devosia sp. TaxID=1871048 RepID=UPI002FC85C9A